MLLYGRTPYMSRTSKAVRGRACRALTGLLPSRAGVQGACGVPGSRWDLCDQFDRNQALTHEHAEQVRLKKLAQSAGVDLRERLKGTAKHTGFDVYCGTAPANNLRSGQGRLLHYSSACLRRTAQAGRRNARPADGACYDASLFDPPGEHVGYLEWIARLTSHIPDRGAQGQRYYGFDSNRSRGRAHKAGSAPAVGPSAASPAESCSDRPSRAQWAALVKKIYECDPLVCRKCGGRMKIVGVIEKPSVIDRILKHIGCRFEVLPLPPPAGRPPPPFLWSAEVSQS